MTDVKGLIAELLEGVKAWPEPIKPKVLEEAASTLARLNTSAVYASAELRHAYRWLSRDGRIDPDLVARAIRHLEYATTSGVTEETKP